MQRTWPYFLAPRDYPRLKSRVSSFGPWPKKKRSRRMGSALAYQQIKRRICRRIHTNPTWSASRTTWPARPSRMRTPGVFMADSYPFAALFFPPSVLAWGLREECVSDVGCIDDAAAYASLRRWQDGGEGLSGR